ncbi:DUF2510 domain-containing protein [Microbacterium sp. SSW1-59]|uniref:DUF2510 domain-containing protein n=1 Tax=Microbacterium xanthum TaxID=3079794 RepID=UPI002AD2063C|nr:DUF2510 domain-containing protein [Microbacterium sp. SSW1-59]MDZ8200134.1 DUF2510 domain-containing protein [Microbacterium sp. SSW1-59]
MSGSAFMKVQAARPAGWYPDVRVPGRERWFDGEAWTSLTRGEATSQKRSCSCDC